jgi:hypothetical protein
MCKGHIKMTQKNILLIRGTNKETRIRVVIPVHINRLPLQASGYLIPYCFLLAADLLDRWQVAFSRIRAQLIQCYQPINCDLTGRNFYTETSELHVNMRVGDSKGEATFLDYWT